MLIHQHVPENCPLCGTPVALLRSREPRSDADRLRDRVAILRERAHELDEGEITPQQLKDEMLWLCPDCQRIMTDLPRLDRRELMRRIAELARQLERTRAVRARRAG